ncbi:hypothetical protein GP486_008805 [Trichoglossum hirsutum]|uniref:Uncharacterized protein n=1 Tax=Trichoglossum hirsutum TaxID=265104 RepID=A0A9P8I340_9PEZI|nr:hypothetical protein GP486_008805 [Trichoglossum hirsutum]
MDIRRSIDATTEVKNKVYADECAAKIERCLETKWDASAGPPAPLELPERPSVVENGSVAIRYWRLMLDLSEKLAAFDEQTAETLNTFRDALKRYGAEATPPRARGADAGLEMGAKDAGKETGGARSAGYSRRGDPAAGKASVPGRGSTNAVGSGEASSSAV